LCWLNFLVTCGRNPNDAPDSDYTGYDFWLRTETNFNGNYINAERGQGFSIFD
jgi:hypothetical protein